MIRKPIKGVATIVPAKNLFNAFHTDRTTCRNDKNNKKTDKEIEKCLDDLQKKFIKDLEDNAYDIALKSEGKWKEFLGIVNSITEYEKDILASKKNKEEKQKLRRDLRDAVSNGNTLLNKVFELMAKIKKIKTKDSPNFGKEFAKAFKSNFKKQLKYIKKKNKK